MIDGADALLENWGRWLRSNPVVRQHCYSIEGRYRSPQCWYPPEPREPDADPHAAMRVERAMPYLPGRSRRALELRYVRRLPLSIVAKRIAIHVGDIDEFMERAKLILKNILTLREKKRIVSADYRDFRLRRDDCSVERVAR